jgi:hypothetical protein
MPDWKSYLSKHLDLPRMRGNREERMISELADHLETGPAKVILQD